jgi:hypothetical protein
VAVPKIKFSGNFLLIGSPVVLKVLVFTVLTKNSVQITLIKYGAPVEAVL